MADQTPKGSKAKFTSEQATGGYIPKPPTPDEVNIISEAQGKITDDWTGEPSKQEKPSPKP